MRSFRTGADHRQYGQSACRLLSGRGREVRLLQLEGQTQRLRTLA